MESQPGRNQSGYDTEETLGVGVRVHNQDARWSPDEPADAARVEPMARSHHVEGLGAGAQSTSAGVSYAALMIADRLRELGIVLPRVFPPAGNYVGCVVDGDIIYVGGHGPTDGATVVTGKVGANVPLQEAKRAARLTGLSILATLDAELGDLDRIERIIKVFGMVNCAPGFNQTPAVIDGCSDLLVEVFGEAGRHTRSAVGLAELPFDIAVEIELIAKLRAD